MGNLDGSALKRIAGPTFPHWLPSGNRLVLITGKSCYQIDANGGNKTLAYRDREAGYLWEAKVSGSGRYLAAVAEIADQADMPMRVVDLRNGRLLHSAPITDMDVAMEGYAAEGRFDWHLATDALAYIPWPPGKPAAGLRTFNPSTGKASTLAQGLKPNRMVWRQGDRTIFVLCDGTVFRVDPGNARGQTVWIPRLPATGEVLDFLQRFLCLQDGQVFYCRAWDQTLPVGFFAKTGEQLEPMGLDGKHPELLWVSGDQIILEDQTDPDDEGHCVMHLLRGTVGQSLSQLETVATFTEWAPDSEVAISPDGTLLAMGMGLRSG